MAKEFVDYYEVLQISRNAGIDTIERVFRYLARKFHPDVSSQNDARFKELVSAYETLRDAEKRSAYDKEWEKDKTLTKELVEGANSTSDDVVERERILSVFYAKRRKDMKNPGVSMSKIAELTNCPPEVLEFHFWYLKSKGWVERLESGQMAITCEGVDRIEESYRHGDQILRIEHQPILPGVESVGDSNRAESTAAKPAAQATATQPRSATQTVQPDAGSNGKAQSEPEPQPEPEPKLDPAEELRRKMKALHTASKG